MKLECHCAFNQAWLTNTLLPTYTDVKLHNALKSELKTSKKKISAEANK